MANSDKNILITPNISAATGTLPNIVFRGADNTPITMRVLDNGTISYEASAGQLFSIAPGLTGSIFSVNDISGIPSIEVLDTGEVKLAQYNGQVTIGRTTVMPAATTTLSPLRIPHGTAPTSPTNGDIWTTTTGLFARVNGSTVGPFGSGGGTTTNALTIGTGLSGTSFNGSAAVTIANTGVLSVNGSTGTITGIATLASPTFTGTPLSTTAAVDTNTTQVATTAFVIGQGYLKSATAASTYSPIAGSSSITTTGTVASGTWSGSFGAVSGANLTSLTAANISSGTLGSGVVPTAGTTTSGASGLGYMGMPQNLNPASPYTITAADAGKHIYKTTTGHTITIPAATALALPIGFTFTVINTAAVSTTISITTDTMYLAGTGTTGSRTLAAYGMATAVKVSGVSSAGVWMISGNGLS